MAAMHVDDTFDDREPEAGRALAGRRFCRQPLEAAEQAPEVFRRQSGAFIGDADHGVEASWGTATMILAPVGEYLVAMVEGVVNRPPMRSEQHLEEKIGGGGTSIGRRLFTAEGRVAL